ncbi:POC1 centriolar protein [Steccherinum ochraceum]|uniref:POC1 centriolar protein n=1 Tax=Steccherinum ochraceum TaxID=92696 RepID=A0A4R0RNQ9_9APHY|nr:POC1 centriolar protein [Steccherinum ochraceum]
MTGRTPSLPQELVEYIIDILWDQHATLRSCSLVSQAWCPRCRYHLRRVVVLSDSDDEAKAALYRDPSITSSVRHLTIRTLHQSQWLSWFPNILPIVEDMKHVTRLRIHVVNWGVRLGDGFFRAQRSSLTHLTLDGVNFDSFATFTYVTAAFHKLESLTLLYVRWVSRLGPVRYEDWADGSKLNLKTLRLGWVFSALAGNLKELVGWLKRGRSTPLCIQHFAFGATNPEDPELQEPMLQLSSSLREIEIFQRIHSWPSLLGSSQTLDATLADKRLTLLVSVTIVGITSDPKLVNCTDMHQVLDQKLPQLAQKKEIQSKLRIQHTYPQWNERSKFLNGSYEARRLRRRPALFSMFFPLMLMSHFTLVSFGHPSELHGSIVGFSFCNLVPIDAAPYRRLPTTSISEVQIQLFGGRLTRTFRTLLNFDMSTIPITILSATQLPQDVGCFASPQFRIKLIVGTTVHKTTWIKDAEPTWNETMALPALDGNYLRIQLWSEGFTSWCRNLIGELDLSDGQLTPLRVGRPTQIELKTFALNTAGFLWISMPPPDKPTEKKDAPPVTDTPIAGTQEPDRRVSVPTARNAVSGLKMVAFKLNGLLGIVDEASKIHVIVSVACSVISSVLEAVKNQHETDPKLLYLLGSMETAYNFAKDLRSMGDITDVLQEYLQEALKQTIECASFVREYCGVGFYGKAYKAMLYGTAVKRVDEFADRFKKLRQARVDGSPIKTNLATYRVLDVVRDARRDQQLNHLQVVSVNAPDRLPCLAGTRTQLVKDLATWLMVPMNGTSNVFWLHGHAGTGKSTISTTVANIFRDQSRLGASIFFSQDSPDGSSPDNVIRALAQQLGLFDPRVGQAVIETLEKNPAITSSPLSMQFAELVHKPISSISSLPSEGPVVVILDGLNECGDPGSRRELLSVLPDWLCLLPKCIRVLITSREDPDIVSALDGHVGVSHQDMSTLPDTNKDISTYIRAYLGSVRQAPHSQHLDLPTDWPGGAKLMLLVKRSAGLFLWAATVCRLIDAHDPQERLDLILHGRSPAHPGLVMDELYTSLLLALGQWNDRSFQNGFQLALGTISSVNSPVSMDALQDFIEIPPMSILERFGCVLSWNTESDPVRLLHSSFRDFLTDPTRSGPDTPWSINLSSHHRRLAFTCLKSIEQDMATSLDIITEGHGTCPCLREEWCPQSVLHSSQHWISYIVQCNPDFELGDKLAWVLLGMYGDWYAFRCISDDYYFELDSASQSLENWMMRYSRGNKLFRTSQVAEESLALLKFYNSTYGPRLQKLFQRTDVHHADRIRLVFESRLMADVFNIDYEDVRRTFEGKSQQEKEAFEGMDTVITRLRQRTEALVQSLRSASVYDALTTKLDMFPSSLSQTYLTWSQMQLDGTDVECIRDQSSPLHGSGAGSRRRTRRVHHPDDVNGVLPQQSTMHFPTPDTYTYTIEDPPATVQFPMPQIPVQRQPSRSQSGYQDYMQ